MQHFRLGRCRQRATLELDRALRQQIRAVHLLADRRQQVEHVAEEEAGEDVAADEAALGHRDVDPEEAAGVADRAVALADQHPLDLERLADDVGGMRGLCDVGDVGVVVVCDQLTLAHRAEQAAEGDERIDVVGDQVVEQALHRVDDDALALLVALAPHPTQQAELLDRHRHAVLVDDRDPALALTELDQLGEQHLVGADAADLELGLTVEIRRQRSRPRDVYAIRSQP